MFLPASEIAFQNVARYPIEWFEHGLYVCVALRVWEQLVQ